MASARPRSKKIGGIDKSVVAVMARGKVTQFSLQSISSRSSVRPC